MNKQTAFIVQLIGELAIPLLGYFLWDWSLLFILLFYLIENLFFSFFRIETVREIKKLVLKKDLTTSMVWLNNVNLVITKDLKVQEKHIKQKNGHISLRLLQVHLVT